MARRWLSGWLGNWLGNWLGADVAVPVVVVQPIYGAGMSVRDYEVFRKRRRKVVRKTPRREPVVVEVLREAAVEAGTTFDVVRLHDRLRVNEIKMPARKEWTQDDLVRLAKRAAVAVLAHEELKVVRVKEAKVQKQRSEEIEALVLIEVA